MSIESLLDILNTNGNPIFITHQKSEGKLTQNLLGKTNNILDICTSVTGFDSAKSTTLRFCLQSTDPNKMMNLPSYITYHVDSFIGEPAKMFGIIANAPFRNIGWTTTAEVLQNETRRCTGVMTSVKVKPVTLDYKTAAGIKEKL